MLTEELCIAIDFPYQRPGVKALKPSRRRNQALAACSAHLGRCPRSARRAGAVAPREAHARRGAAGGVPQGVWCRSAALRRGAPRRVRHGPPAVPPWTGYELGRAWCLLVGSRRVLSAYFRASDRQATPSVRDRHLEMRASLPHKQAKTVQSEVYLRRRLPGIISGFRSRSGGIADWSKYNNHPIGRGVQSLRTCRQALPRGFKLGRVSGMACASTRQFFCLGLQNR